MKAVVIREHSSEPNNLLWEERPEPDPAHGEVRVRVQAVSLNHLDTWVRRGLPGHSFPLPLVPGSDAAGVVDALGPGTSGKLSEGDRVILAPSFGCGRCRSCAEGQEQLCRRFQIRGESCDGVNQELVCCPESHVLPCPAGLSPAEAAAMPLVFLTAWHMLVGRCAVRPGQTVLLHAAGSGVSSAGIQIAKLAGCRVIATAGQDRKLALATRLGADYTINYREEDWPARARELAGKEGVDVVVDHIGADTLSQSLALLNKGGKVVSCGTTSGALVEINMARIFFLGLSLLGSTMGSRGELHRIVQLAGEGKLKPVLDTILPWSDVAKGHERLAERDVAGKIVLEL